tara:strand:- start:7035 stop:7157 length:123 start_codon:yes stop_codon:yes gene_type:complete
MLIKAEFMKVMARFIGYLWVIAIAAVLITLPFWILSKLWG